MQDMSNVKQLLKDQIILSEPEFYFTSFVILNIRNNAHNPFSGYERWITTLKKHGYDAVLVRFATPTTYLILSAKINQLKDKNILYPISHVIAKSDLADCLHPTLNQENVNKLIFNSDLGTPPETLFIKKYEQITGEEFFDLRGFKNSNLAMEHGKPNTFYRILR